MIGQAPPDGEGAAEPPPGRYRALWARSWKVLLALELVGLVLVGIAIFFFADSLGGAVYAELAGLAVVGIVIAALAYRRRRAAERGRTGR